MYPGTATYSSIEPKVPNTRSGTCAVESVLPGGDIHMPSSHIMCAGAHRLAVEYVLVVDELGVFISINK